MPENDNTLKNISLVILGIVALLALVGLMLVFVQDDNKINGEFGKNLKKMMRMNEKRQTAQYKPVITPPAPRQETQYSCRSGWTLEGTVCSQIRTGGIVFTNPDGTTTTSDTKITEPAMRLDIVWN